MVMGLEAHDIQGEAQGMGFVQPRKEAAQGDFTTIYDCLMGRHTEDRAGLCIEVGRDKMMVDKHILQ